jgi:hypothetical protein
MQTLSLKLLARLCFVLREADTSEVALNVANIGFEILTREGVDETVANIVLAAFMFLLVSHSQAFGPERLHTLRAVCEEVVAETDYELLRRTAVVVWFVLVVDFEMEIEPAKLHLYLQFMPPDVDDEGMPLFAQVIWRLYQANPEQVPRIADFAVAVVATSHVYTRHMAREQYELWKAVVREIAEDDVLAMLRFDEANLLALHRNLE